MHQNNSTANVIFDDFVGANRLIGLSFMSQDKVKRSNLVRDNVITHLVLSDQLQPNTEKCTFDINYIFIIN